MAVFIYAEKWDSCGEGIRGTLTGYASQAAAHEEMERLKKDDQCIGAKMVIGNITEEFDSDPDTVDDVQISA